MSDQEDLSRVMTIYSEHEFSAYPGRILDEINASGQQAAITRMGRFVALITPLANVQVEALVLTSGPIKDELDRRSAEHDAKHTSDIYWYRYQGKTPVHALRPTDGREYISICDRELVAQQLSHAQAADTKCMRCVVGRTHGKSSND